MTLNAGKSIHLDCQTSKGFSYGVTDEQSRASDSPIPSVIEHCQLNRSEKLCAMNNSVRSERSSASSSQRSTEARYYLSTNDISNLRMMTNDSLCTDVYYATVVYFINGESIQVGVTESEGNSSKGCGGERDVPRTVRKVGQSRCREKETAGWKLEQELSQAELAKASIPRIQAQLDSLDSDWEACLIHN